MTDDRPADAPTGELPVASEPRGAGELPPPPATGSSSDVPPVRGAAPPRWRGYPGVPLTSAPLSTRGALAYGAYCILLNVALTAYTHSDAVSGLIRDFIGQVARRLGAPIDVVAALVSGVFMVLVYGLVLTPAVLIARRRGVRFRDQVGLRPFKAGPAIGIAAIMICLALCVGVQYGLLLLRLGVKYQGNTAGLTRVFGASPIGMLVLFGVGAVVAPFAEEVVFRGVVFSSLRESWREPWAILVSSVLFGVIHLDPLAMVPTAIVGLMLARVFLTTRSLWASILAHSAYNAFVLSIALMTQRLVG